LNVVDSSGWLEYFADSPNAKFFATPIEDTRNLIVPSLSILEVFKKILREIGESSALQAVAHMRMGKVVDLDLTVALASAKTGLERKLPLADSVMLATAVLYNATLWTQDDDFKGLPGVRYFPKKRT
jgi:predicted nucleic acid-binding protein